MTIPYRKTNVTRFARNVASKMRLFCVIFKHCGLVHTSSFYPKGYYLQNESLIENYGIRESCQKFIDSIAITDLYIQLPTIISSTTGIFEQITWPSFFISRPLKTTVQLVHFFNAPR